MPLPTFRPGRFAYVGVLLLGLGLLLGAGWIYRYLLQSAYGSFDRSGASAVAAFDEGGRIALLASRYTIEANAARGPRGVDPAWLADGLRTWRAFLLNAQVPFDEVTDEQVEAGHLDGYDLLILPSAQALSDAEIEQIKAFLDSGRSVLATWTPGIYHPDGTWRGWDFVEETFGVEFQGFVERGYANYRTYTETFPGLTPPGLYRPDAEAPAAARTSRIARQAKAAGFGPLSGYTWTAPLNAERPAASFALADTVGGSSTRVTYFTWLGGAPSAQETADAPFRRVTFRAGTPLSAGLPAAFRMKVGTFDAPLTVRVAEPRTQAAAFWYDFAAEDRVAEDALATTAAAVYGTYGRGRFVYLGHELSAMGYDLVDQGALAQLFENALRWLGRAPVAWIEPWPAGHRAAAFVAGVAETDAAPLAAAAEVFREAEARPTFFLPADDRQPDLYRRLATVGEVALLGRAGAPTYEREQLAALTGSETSGIYTHRPADARALARRGFAYAYADSVGRALQPERIGEDEALILFPKSARTDREIWARTPAGSHDVRWTLLHGDIARTAYEGGLYTLLYHTDALAAPAALPLLRQTLAELRERGFWLASGPELAAWWQARDGVHCAVDQQAPRRLLVRVSNEGTVAAEDFHLTLALGQPVGAVTVRSELVGVPVPEHALGADGMQLTLRIDRLRPRQYRTFLIDLELRDEAAEAEIVATAE